jgi:hypothetical protein
MNSGNLSILSLVSSKTKHCVKCGQTKSTDKFYADKSKSTGFSSYCKSCKNEYRKEKYAANKTLDKQYYKEYHQKNPDKSKMYGLKIYGLSLTQFNDMRENQNFSCKICKTHESNLKRKLFVDHCHATGKVRGLLCQSCNTMIGNAKDSVLVLQAGINYLAGV